MASGRLKYCPKCKGIELFGVNSRAKNGLQTYCIKCRNLVRTSEHTRSLNRLWKSKNADKARKAVRDSKRKHKATVNYVNSNRRAAKLKAVPKWLTKEQRKEIRKMYKEAQVLKKIDGIDRHVDHIIPLISDIVCGLHVPWNLQILTAHDNIVKSNKI